MSLKSTMDAPFGDTGRKAVPGVYDHNVAPVINKPRDTGKDAQPERFFEDVKGGKPTTLDSTMTQGTEIQMNK